MTGKVLRKSALKDIVSWRTKSQEELYTVSTPCMDDHHFKKEELDSVGELSKVCSQIVLKCSYLAIIGRLEKTLVREQTCTSCHKMDSSL